MSYSLQDLLKFSIPSVYALVNDLDRRVYIGYSHNLLLSVAQLCRSIKVDVNSLQLVILEECNNEFRGRLLAQYYLDKYRLAGYTSYRYRDFIKAKFVMNIEKLTALDYERGVDKSLYKGRYISGYRFIIRFKVRNGNSIICGIFHNKDEAETFLLYANTQNMISPVIALNSETEEFYKANKNKYNGLFKI